MKGTRRMPSATPATPADVLARRRQLMLAGDGDGLADLFAPDAVIEFSFHGSPGIPVRLAGREVIRAYSRQVMASLLRLEEDQGAGADPAAGPGGVDGGDAAEGARHPDGPAAHGIVHPGPPDPGRSYRALPRLRRSP